LPAELVELGEERVDVRDLHRLGTEDEVAGGSPLVGGGGVGEVDRLTDEGGHRRPPCAGLLLEPSPTVTVEAIQEFVHVRARRRSRDDAARYGRAYATLFAPLTEPSAPDLHRGLELFEHHPELGAFDAVLAATARRVSDGAVASATGGFRVVDGLRLAHPADDDFEAALLELGR